MVVLPAGALQGLQLCFHRSHRMGLTMEAAGNQSYLVFAIAPHMAHN